MQVTTIDEARALVGRTFERDGTILHPYAVLGNGLMLAVCQVAVSWVLVAWDIDELNQWFSGAKELPNGDAT